MVYSSLTSLFTDELLFFIYHISHQITKLQLFSFDNIRQQLQHNLMLCTIESEIEIRKAQLLFITSSTDQYKKFIAQFRLAAAVCVLGLSVYIIYKVVFQFQNLLAKF